MKSIKLITLAVLTSCTFNTEIKPVITAVEEIIKPAVVKEVPITKTWKTPVFAYTAPKGMNMAVYDEALKHIADHANTDRFYRYVVSKRTYFAHTNKMKVTDAIKKFRDQLDKGETVKIRFYTPVLKGKSIGGWNNIEVLQNSKFILTAERRAGHLLHEVSHKYNWVHEGNKSYANDNPNSFPYAMGYDFEDYLLSLKKPVKLAGEL